MLTKLTELIREQRVKKLVSMRRIETIINEEQRRCYSIAHVAFGIVGVRRKLEVTPTAITFGGDSFFTREWSIPTAELFPSCVTYFRREQSIVIGINYRKTFYPISLELSTDEIETLLEELQVFLEKHGASNLVRQNASPKFTKELIEGQGMRFLIPYQFKGFKIFGSLGLLLGGVPLILSLLMWRIDGTSRADNEMLFFFGSLLFIPSALRSLSMMFWKRRIFHVLEITPNTVRLLHKWFSVPFGEGETVSLADIKPSAINWHYQEKHVLIAITSGNRSLEFATAGYLPEDADMLIRDLRKAVVSMKNTPTPTAAEIPIGRSCSPEGIDTEKIRLDEHRWQYRIPGNFGEAVQSELLWAVALAILFGFVTVSLFFMEGLTEGRDGKIVMLLVSILFALSFVNLGKIFQRILGKTIVTLSPQWIQLTYILFGFRLTRRVPTRGVTNIAIVQRYVGKSNHPVMGINLCTRRKTLRFSSYLPADENNWLGSEIKAFLATVSAPGYLLELDATITITDNCVEIAFPRFSIIWPFWTNEIISISANTLTLCVKTFKQGRSQQFNVKEIKHLRIAEKGYRDGTLIFDYYQAPISFARAISDAEAKMLCKQLNDILTFRCQSVEQIVFGDLPPVFIGTPDTLLMNPDVSELSFPFIRLRRLILDAATHDPRLVERFLTYAVNAIGQRKLKESVDVHIYGNPALLLANLRNNVDNLFRRVEQHHHE